MEKTLQDLRYAFRRLARSPAVGIVAVLTLTLGIGANAAIFGVVDGVLLEPLPYDSPDRLAAAWPGQPLPPGILDLLREEADAFETLAAYAADSDVTYGADRTATLTGTGEPLRVGAVGVSRDLFHVLGVRPGLGRGFRPGRKGAPGGAGAAPSDEVVLSHGFWQRRFGGDPDVVGRRLVLDGTPHTVVGVMPRGFRFPSEGTEFWHPLVSDPTDPGTYWGRWNLRAVGRLTEGMSVEAARTELRALAPRMRDAFPWDMPADWGADADVLPLRESMVGNVRPALLLLLGAVGFVLLIACVNIGNLLLARTAGRRREAAIRTALGAGRLRLFRQLLTEALLLAGLGGAAGLLLSVWGTELLVGLLPADTPRLAEVGTDLRVAGFALAASVLAGLLAGTLPALRAAGADPGSSLAAGGERSGTDRGRSRLSRTLVVAEVALAVVLLVGAGLMIRSFRTLRSVDPGFRPAGVVSAEVAPPGFRYGSPERLRAYYGRLLGRVASLPGTRSAAVTNQLPFSGPPAGSAFLVEGRPRPRGGDYPTVDRSPAVTPDYFRTMGIPLRAGRTFTEADDADAPRTVVIDRRMADRYWPGEDPVGQRIRLPGREDEWWTIVGVVGSVRARDLAAPGGPTFYRPLAQEPAGTVHLVVRAGDPDAVASSLRETVSSVDPDVPVSDIRTMEVRIATSVERPRSTTLLLAAFAIVALVLSALGIYGVISHAVARRRREIGIRMAVGARAGHVSGMVLREGGILTLAGLALGLTAAWALARLLSFLLYGVEPLDPAVYAAVPAVLGGVALLAAWVPARRAARVDPMVTLRSN